ncbi:MAG: hypothetical protein WCI73_00265 [Phycisphaerae bacterium]
MQDPPSSIGVSSPLVEALVDAVALFNRLGISYALIGGFAAMVYSRARPTEDLDFVAAESYEQVLAAHPEVMRECHFDPACTWMLYHRSGATIDIWKDEYSGAIAARAQEKKLANQMVRVVEVHDLVAMKLRANRFQDDYDISEILKANHIDDSVLTQRVTAAQMEHFQAIRRRLETPRNT